MKKQTRPRFQEILDAVTTPSLLKPLALLAVTLLTTLVHAVTSVDLGYQDLILRIPIAILSVLPLFGVIWLAHRVSRKNKKLRYLLVPVAYLVGGALRGAVLEQLLIVSGVLRDDFASYRIFAGLLIVGSTCIFVAYSWATAERAGEVVNHLEEETFKLAQALSELLKKSEIGANLEILNIQERIGGELKRLISIKSDQVQTGLNHVVEQMVRPLSQEFAKGINGWNPPKIKEFQLTFPAFWASINLFKHLPTPVIVVFALVISAIASLFAFFDLRNSIELIVAVSISLLISIKIAYFFMKKWFMGLQGLARDLATTVMFFAIAIPAALVQRIVLADTTDPGIYVPATLIITPTFGWLILIGNAALGLAREVTTNLKKTRADLRWVIARINLLGWYRKGVISRLLHGPIQNNIQVAILRLKSADEGLSGEIVADVYNQIEEAIEGILDPELVASQEFVAVESIKQVWGKVADVQISVTDHAKSALLEDSTAAIIVNDLLHELCSNSIRHGGAKSLSIEMDSVAGLIEIKLIDDGAITVRKGNEGGLGTKFLEECSVTWSQRNITSGKELLLAVPTTYESLVKF